LLFLNDRLHHYIFSVAFLSFVPTILSLTPLLYGVTIGACQLNFQKVKNTEVVEVIGALLKKWREETETGSFSHYRTGTEPS
jgi:hypothetical protein